VVHEDRIDFEEFCIVVKSVEMVRPKTPENSRKLLKTFKDFLPESCEYLRLLPKLP